MTIMPYGDSAALVNFEQIIDEEINAKVVALSDAILSANIEGVTFCIPAYCSLTVGFNPRLILYRDLIKYINEFNSNTTETPVKSNSRKINIPVCYNEDFALDRDDVVNQTHLSWEEIVRLHTSHEYRVYMLGFIAGFGYMGTLPHALKCNRKANPRMDIQSGTVGIAGLQTGVYPTKAHAGWQLIGRTPIPVFDYKGEDPFLFRAGDRVQFHAIEPDMYVSMRAEIESGKFKTKSVVTHE